MPSVQNVSLTAPTDYNAEALSIERRRKLAEAFQAQSMQPLETNQTAGGWVVPISPFQGAAKLAQALSAGYGQARADKEQKELAAKYQTDLADVFTRAAGATGTKEIQPDPQEAEQSADQGTPAVNAAPAKSAQQQQMEIYASHPATQPIAMQLAQQQAQRAALMQALKSGSAPQGNPMAAGGGSVMAPAGSAPAASGAAVGGPAGGVPMEAWIQADPTGKLYMEQLAKDKAESDKPVINRGFGLGRMVNGKYVPDEASLEQATAIEKLKAGLSVHPVTNAAGAQVPTFGYQLPGFGGAGQPQLPQAQPATPQSTPQPTPQAAPVPAASPAAFPRETPAQASSAKAKSLEILQAEAKEQQDTKGSVDPELQREIQRAGGQADPWATMPKRQIPQGVGQTTFDKVTSEHQATKANELSTKYGELADHANQRMMLNNQALSLVDKADTGPAAAGIADVKNWLTSRFGISEDRFQNTPSATIALQKDLLNAATQKAKAQFGARMTQSEVLLMLSKGAPNVDMTKAAIKYLINSDNAAAQYQIKQANDLGQYLQQGGDPMRFDAWYSKSFPMSQAVDKVHLQTNAVKDIVNSGTGQPVKTVKWSDLK